MSEIWVQKYGLPIDLLVVPEPGISTEPSTYEAKRTTNRLKKCSACGREQDLMMFRQSKHGLTKKCIRCCRRHTARQHGLPAQAYDDLWEEQQGHCRICGTMLDERAPQGATDSPHLDHCHETGKIRGILCAACNQGLGHFNDNAVALMKAAEYVVSHAV